MRTGSRLGESPPHVSAHPEACKRAALPVRSPARAASAQRQRPHPCLAGRPRRVHRRHGETAALEAVPSELTVSALLLAARLCGHAHDQRLRRSTQPAAVRVPHWYDASGMARRRTSQAMLLHSSSSLPASWFRRLAALAACRRCRCACACDRRSTGVTRLS